MPDPLVAAAVANWGPRFVLRGVDYNDFLAIARIQTWAGWLDGSRCWSSPAPTTG